MSQEAFVEGCFAVNNFFSIVSRFSFECLFCAVMSGPEDGPLSFDWDSIYGSNKPLIPTSVEPRPSKKKKKSKRKRSEVEIPETSDVAPSPPSSIVLGDTLKNSPTVPANMDELASTFSDVDAA